jgi:hypothetical protein
MLIKSRKTDENKDYREEGKDQSKTHKQRVVE